MANDPVAALVTYLDSQLDVPVYGATFQGTPPGVLVRSAGGGTLAQGYMPTVDARLDVRCYHDTDWQAAELDRQVAVLLHHLDSEVTTQGTIRWCRTAGGPNQLRETDTNWPASLTSWQVYGDWLAAV